MCVPTMFKIRPFFNLSTKFLNKRVGATFSTRSKIEDINPEEPIKFSASPANKYRARFTIRGSIGESRLWYEPYVLLTSIAVFLIYFTILREENDIDQELSRSLYSRIEGLEESQLRQSLDYNQQHGLDTKAIIERLNEIEREKQHLALK